MESSSRKFSIQLLVRLFFMLSFLILGTCLLFFSYMTYKSDLKAVRSSANQNNLKKILEIEKKLSTRLRKIHSQIADACSFQDRASLLHFQSNSVEELKKLNRNLMLPEDYQLYLKGEGIQAVDIKAFHLTFVGWKYVQNNLSRLFGDSDYLFGKTSKDYFRKDLDVAMKIAQHEFNPVFDETTRTVTISDREFYLLDAMDGNKDGKISHPDFKNLINPYTFHFNSDRYSWTPIPEESIFEGVEEKDHSKLESSSRHYTGPGSDRIIPLTWSVLFLYRKNLLFGGVPHTYANLIEKGLKFSPQKHRKKVYYLGKYAMTWDMFPRSFNTSVIKKKNLLYPEKVIAASILDEFILKRILHDFMKESGHEGRLFAISGAKNSRRFYQKGNSAIEYENDLKASLPESMNIKGEVQHFSWNNQKGSHFATVLRSNLNMDTVWVYAQNKENFLTPLYLRWFTYLFMVLVAILAVASVVSTQIRNMSSSVQDCLDYIISGPVSLQSESRGDEFEHLLQKLLQFSRNIDDKVHFFRLNSLFHKVLGKPRQSLIYYLDEFRYLCSDIASRFHFQIDSRPGGEHNFPLELDSEQEQSLSKHLETETPLFLNFEQELSEQEQRIFQKQMSYIIEKSKSEKELIESDKLKADLELSKTLQEDLSPMHPLLDTSTWRIRSSIKRSPTMQFDCLEVKDRGDTSLIYYFDLSLQGLGSAILSTYLKAYLDGLCVSYVNTGEILGKMNHFLLKEGLDGLLLSMFVGILSQNQLRFSMAGFPPVFVSSKSGDISSFQMKQAPLGLQYDREFEQELLKLESGDKVYISGNGFYFKDGIQASHVKARIQTILEDDAEQFFEGSWLDGQSIEDDLIQCLVEIHETKE